MNFPYKKLYRYASKVTALLVLMVVVFSPFWQITTVSIVQAQNFIPTTFDDSGGASLGQGNQAAFNNSVKNLGKVGEPDPLACGFDNVSVCLANVIYAFTVGLGSGLAYVGGFMLDVSVSLSLNSAAYALTFLSDGWTAARDLANMAFILILVYIAFTIMFQAETAGTIKMLAWVIFIALIINFSFFFTRVVIDVGNILAVQFYNSIQAPSLQETMDVTSRQTGVMANAAAGAAIAASPQGSLANTKDLTSSIMQALNMQALFSNESFKSFSRQSGFGTKFIVLSFLYIMVGACYFILAAMFFAVAIKFIVRVAVLWFLIIASPLAFICKAMPEKSGIPDWYDRWQHELIRHAFYPAFFLFIFFFISSIMKTFGTSGGMMDAMAKSLNAAASDPNLNGFIYIASAVANVGIRLGFVVAMLYIALKASEHMGARGGEIAQRATSFAFGQTGRLAAMPGRIIGQNTFGRAGSAMVNNKYLATRAAAGNNILTRGAWKGLDRTTKATGTALGKASYDVRDAPGANIVKKGFEKISGGVVNAGEPAKGGFMAQAKERDERRKVAEKEEKQKEREEKNLAAIKELAKKSTEHDELAAKEAAGTIAPAEKTQKAALKHQITQIEKKINGLNKGEVESYKMADIQKVIKHLNKDTVKKINESDKFTEAQKEAIRTEHDQKMRENVGGHAVEKSQEIVEELRGLRQVLLTNANIPAASLDKLEHATRAGNALNLAVIREADTQIKNQKVLAEAVQLSATSSQEDKDRAKYAVDKIKEARAHIETLKTHISDVPETIGNTSNAKEFLVA